MTKIAAPGIYDLPIADHHGDICDGPSLSAGDIVTLASQCPAKYWVRSCLNPQRIAGERTRALDLGIAYNAMLLEGGLEARAVVAPYDDFRAKEARDWRDEQERAGRVVLKASEHETLIAMKRAFEANPVTARALKGGTPEQSYVYKDAETGVWLKVRPDLVPDDPLSFVKDLKTALSIAPGPFGAQAWKLGYHIKAALFLDAVEQLRGERRPGVALAAQEKDPPYLSGLLLVPPEAIEKGRAEARRAIRLFAECWERKTWPGYYDDVAYLEVPRWAMSDPEREASMSTILERESSHELLGPC